MKYFIGIAVLGAVILTGYFIFGTGTSPAELNVAAAEPVSVSMVKQTVYHSGAASARAEVVEPVKALEGDEVETLASGRALIEMQNGTLTTLDYSTKVTIKTHTDDEHSSMSLEGGKVWSTVEKVFGKGEYYEIETQNAVAVVRGTSFSVSYDGENTVLEVSEGTVLFVPIDPQTGERLYGEAILVTAGEKATVGKNGVVQALDNADTSTTPTVETSAPSEAPDIRILDVDIRPGQ